MSATRRRHTATLLRDHTVLTVGGFQAMSNAALARAERYYPGAGSWSSAGAMAIPRYDHSATLLENGDSGRRWANRTRRMAR